MIKWLSTTPPFKMTSMSLLLADSMAWVDGSPLDYSSWPSKAPDVKLLTADTCVTTRAVDGVWLLLGCTERLGFVCKTISGDLGMS